MHVQRTARLPRGPAGLTLLELMFSLGIVTTILAIALPLGGEAIDSLRTAAAARYLAGRIHLARLEAVKRSASVALRFEPTDDDYRFTTYVDGNQNGIRTADITRGIDVPLTTGERLGDNFSVVRFGVLPGIPDIDGGAYVGDGVRIGSARILTMSANGTATAGTLYLRGRRAQYAVRVLGATGRTRVLVYDTGERAWISR
jgi:type II secretory pathway pseudopilin PulG